MQTLAAAIKTFPPTFGLHRHPTGTFRISLRSSFLDDCGQPVFCTEVVDGLGNWVDFQKFRGYKLREQLKGV